MHPDRPAEAKLDPLNTASDRQRGQCGADKTFMGFPGEADQRIKATKLAPVNAARRKKQENTLIVELRIAFNNAKKPCGGCAAGFSHLFWQARAAPFAGLFAIPWVNYSRYYIQHDLHEKDGS